ncbi:MAG: GNAT family N-acetyltransferase [Spirochaetales bacterium]|nr:GNAT family N-acetyltransferase [Spirochaetales bacterium]
MLEYKIKLLKDDKNLSNKHWEVVKTIWPKIMLNSKVAKKYWNKLEKYFPHYQIFLLNRNNDVIGFSNTIPFYWDKRIMRLPDNGWDWLINKGIDDYEKQLKPNCLGGLQVGISKEYQGKGYSKIIINEVLNICKTNGYRYFAIPIRPTYKYRYPLIPMKKYIKWKMETKIFDPWLRTHINCGAKIIKICKKSMTFTGSIKDWKEWSGMDIIGNEKYIIEGALKPVSMNVKKNKGVYYDENIWICYEIQ